MKKYLYVSILCASLLHAQEPQDFGMLSLEELLNVQVTSTSRRAESQHLASGIITVISSQEMQKYGSRHIRDVLDRLVGMEVLGSRQDPHSKMSIRAFNTSHHESHVLILLNGRPVRQATDGGLNSDLYLGFPVNIVDRIEVIRGPGSVIYGSNAVTGVVNIVTKDARKTINETQVDVQAGSFNRQQIQLSTLFGDTDYSVNIGLNHITANGDTVHGMTDEDGNIGSYESGQDSKNIVVAGNYKDFTLNYMFMDNDLESGSSAFQFPSKEIRLQRYFLDVGYLYDITDGWDISFNYTMSKDSADWQINEAVGDNRSDARSDLYEVIVRGNISEKLNMLFGASRVKNESGFLRGLPQGTTLDNDIVYTQIDYMFSQKQKLILGAQWNKPSNYEADISPRVGFIQGFGENWWLKLLYSEAYRSPTMVELNLAAPQLKGNPNLSPESVKTYDAQLLYNNTKMSLGLTLYKSKLSNLIIRVPGAPITHANQGYVEFKGVEFEAKYEADENLDFIGNLSYQNNETDAGDERTTFAPDLMAKLGVTYDGLNGVTLSAFNSYYSTGTDLSQDLPLAQRAPAINKKADSYNILTANAVVDTGVAFDFGKPGHSFVSIFLDNLFDEDVYAADLNFANKNNTIPHHWGRGIYVTYTYKL